MEASRASRLRHLMNTEGWGDIASMLEEQISEAKDAIYNIMTSNPDTLTGKKAIGLANRARALEEFKESLLEAKQISPQPVRAGVR